LIQQRIEQLGLQDHVLLTGILPPNAPRVIGLFQSAQALLLPSLSETFGLVILEAWAAGTPVISARASGPAALIQNGYNGWLFDLEDPQSFHSALERTLADPALAKQMANRGTRLTEEYSLATLAARLRGIYQELIKERLCVT
jgi:glycosyltransferase involved in cell wall biosynthesis